ncbi:hypothetical protein NDU88_007479 [Pleurodeles waltl]|uniref:Uncharacterized protein n=1 Tax=Pleurodeles waltl TaxID=8319 RepID=A0AAV7U190_PLEWA|nr:hypothetical protein NDU88_007479 [Pleurodeles waltl]
MRRSSHRASSRHRFRCGPSQSRSRTEFPFARPCARRTEGALSEAPGRRFATGRGRTVSGHTVSSAWKCDSVARDHYWPRGARRGPGLPWYVTLNST